MSCVTPVALGAGQAKETEGAAWAMAAELAKLRQAAATAVRHGCCRTVVGVGNDLMV
jgi:hypothetical protein